MKATIPKALREQVWIKINGKHYTSRCSVIWCKNKIDVFNFHVGHNIPESKGGETVLENLRPICCRCNLSMGNTYTIDEWNKLGKPVNCLSDFWNYFKTRLF
jgi:5-methylcytosine-specific restriction endonuclease McrA